MKYSKALNEIYENINAGNSYGKDFLNVRYPFFDTALSANKQYIYWRHYGSSANKNTRKELYWIITVIFRMSPEQFLQEYITEDQSKFY